MRYLLQTLSTRVISWSQMISFAPSMPLYIESNFNSKKQNLSKMNKELLNSVDLTNKIFALCLLMLVFALTTCLFIVTLLLSYQHLCRSKDRTNRRRKPTPEFVSWVQKNLSKRYVRRQKSGASIFRDNIIIKHELDAHRWAEVTFQEDNVLEDLEFYEMRSEIDSIDFGQDLQTKLKWEETLKTQVLRAPSNNEQKSIPRKLKWHSNVRRNLLEEFENQREIFV